MHLQCLGLPESAAKCSVSINRNMRHHVRTNAGKSSNFYQHSEDYFKGSKRARENSNPIQLAIHQICLTKLTRQPMQQTMSNQC
eukprot:4919027-Ditylum_brightwellii.AAC.1